MGYQAAFRLDGAGFIMMGAGQGIGRDASHARGLPGTKCDARILVRQIFPVINAIDTRPGTLHPGGVLNSSAKAGRAANHMQNALRRTRMSVPPNQRALGGLSQFEHQNPAQQAGAKDAPKLG